MKNTKNLERKSSADRITCFLPLYYNPLVQAQDYEMECVTCTGPVNIAVIKYCKKITS